MIDYSIDIKSPCQPLTGKVFERLTTSSKVREAIIKARECENSLEFATDDALRKVLETEKNKAKSTLPCIMFQASFMPSQKKKGEKEQKWRNNANAVLNGLYIIDIDHIEQPTTLWQECLAKAKEAGVDDKIMMAFVTASGHGLKLVCKADLDGNIAENQERMCGILGIAPDPACKDAARASYCPCKEDILFINNSIFDYENKEYEKKYGESYRKGSRGTAKSKVSKGVSTVCATSTSDVEFVYDEKKVCATFRGVPYKQIVDAYEAMKGGKAEQGLRHHRIQEMSNDLRHICDNDYSQLLWTVRQSETAKEIDGRAPGEIESLVAGAVRLRKSVNFPDSVVKACGKCGISLSDPKTDDTVEPEEIDYQAWWQRLKPFLHPEMNADGVVRDPYAAALGRVEDEMKLGGILTSGAMYGTYLTRCKFKHYDARLYRFSYIVYLVGNPASGKSYIKDLDDVIMHRLKQQDEIGRAMEREYAAQKEKAELTKGKKESQVTEKPKCCIRYVPSTISNHVLYNRLINALDPDNPDGEHLHLYTMETELATAMRAQVGSWAGKLDLELKSFQNECAGVDFANNGSANGIIQINWNQVVSSTMDTVLKKVRATSLNDGFITRLAIWLMPDSPGKMIDYEGDQPIKGVQKELTEEEMRIVELTKKFDSLAGIIPCEPLVRHVYDWCAEQAMKASIEEDKLTEYFRKRIPLYMIRYTLPRILAREYDTYTTTGVLTITDEDKAFATLIGDWLMYISIRTWGNRLLDLWNSRPIEGMPRQRKSKLMERYEKLPEVFTFNDFSVHYSSEHSARQVISSLVRCGCIVKVAKNTWRKSVSELCNTAPTRSCQ